MADVDSQPSPAEEKQQEMQNREGWLKMVRQEINETQEETIARNGTASTKGVI
jgi:hypothetical protein